MLIYTKLTNGRTNDLFRFGTPVLVILLLISFSTPCTSFTEIFNIVKDSDDSTYYVGNRDSNFFVGKRNVVCASQWTSTAGSTSGDDDNDENTEILYDVLIGNDGLIYAVGSTRGNFSFPSEEVPNLDAAVVVYDPVSGNLVRQMQYDIQEGNNNIAHAIVQKPDGNLLVAVFGSISNIQSTALYETRLLEINPTTLQVTRVYPITISTTEALFPVSGGPRMVDFLYEEETNSIVALGHILGRGLLWKYSLTSEQVIGQIEWGEAFGNFEISAFTRDEEGAFYVVGSSSSPVLGNSDLANPTSSDFHAYVIKFDSESSGFVSEAWVRQLSGDGSSQSGNDITIDPVTNQLVVVGSFDTSFQVTDAQTGTTFQVDTVEGGALTDVYIWYLEPENGDFSELRLSSGSTISEDHGNAVEVLSNRRVEIGGVRNDGNDDNPAVCDESNLASSISPTPSTSVSLSPAALASISASSSTTPVLSVTVSPVVSTGISASLSISPVPSATPSPIGPTVSPSIPSATIGATASISLSSGFGPTLSPSFDVSPSFTNTVDGSDNDVFLPSGSPIFSPSNSVSEIPLNSAGVFPSLSTSPDVFPSTSLIASPVESQSPQVPTATLEVSLSPSSIASPTSGFFASPSGDISGLVEEPNSTPNLSPNFSGSFEDDMETGPLPSDNVGVPLPVASAAAELAPFETPDLEPSSQLFSEISQAPVVSSSVSFIPDAVPSTSDELVKETGSLISPLETDIVFRPEESNEGLVNDIVDDGFRGSVEPSVGPAMESVDPSSSFENIPLEDVTAVPSDFSSEFTATPEASQSPDFETDGFVGPLPQESIEPTSSGLGSTEEEGNDFLVESPQLTASTDIPLSTRTPIQSADLNPTDGVNTIAPSDPPTDFEFSFGTPIPSETADDSIEPTPASETENLNILPDSSSEPHPTASEDVLTVIPSSMPIDDEDMDTGTSPESSVSPEGQLPTMEPSLEMSFTPEASLAPSADPIQTPELETFTSSAPETPTELQTPSISVTTFSPSGLLSPSPTFLGPTPLNTDPSSLLPTPVSPEITQLVTPFDELSGSESPQLLPSIGLEVPTTTPPPIDILGEASPTSENDGDGDTTTISPQESFDGNMNSSPDISPGMGSGVLPDSSFSPVVPDASDNFQSGSPGLSPEAVMESVAPIQTMFIDAIEPSATVVPIADGISSTPPIAGETISGSPEASSAENVNLNSPIPSTSQPAISSGMFSTSPTAPGVNIATPSSSPGSVIDRDPGNISQTASPSIDENIISEGSTTPGILPSISPLSSSSTSVDISPSTTPEPISSGLETQQSSPGVSPSAISNISPSVVPSPSVTGQNGNGNEVIVDLGSATPRPTPSFSPSALLILDVSPSVAPSPSDTSQDGAGNQVIIDLGSATPRPTPSVSPSQSLVSNASPATNPSPSGFGQSGTGNEVFIDLGSATPRPTPSGSPMGSLTADISPSSTPAPITSEQLPGESTIPADPEETFGDNVNITDPVSSSVPDFAANSSLPPSPMLGNTTGGPSTPILSSSTPELTSGGQMDGPFATDVVELTASPFDENLPSPESSATPQFLLESSSSPLVSLFPEQDASPSFDAVSGETPESTFGFDAEPSLSPIATFPPIEDISPTPSPSGEVDECIDRVAVVNASLLSQTANFQRVKMSLQIAGRNLTDSCELTTELALEFIKLSASNTLSHFFLWFVTSVEDGPAVFSAEPPLVVVEDLETSENTSFTTPSVSPSPIAGDVSQLLFRSSIVFNVTVFFEPLSVGLAEGSYVEYITSQNIVSSLQDNGVTDIEWTGMLGSPQVLDGPSTSGTGTTSLGTPAGIIMGTLFGAVLLMGIVVFMYDQGFFGLGTTPRPLLPV